MSLTLIQPEQLKKNIKNNIKKQKNKAKHEHSFIFISVNTSEQYLGLIWALVLFVYN